MSAAAACLFTLIVGWLSGGWLSGGWTSDPGRSDTGAPISTARVERSPTSSLEVGSFEVGPRAVLVSDRDGLLSPAERRRLDRSPRGTVHLPLAHERPIERGGFRVDQTSPTFVNFGLPNVSCLPRAPREDLSGYHEGPSCEVILPAGGSTRGPRRDAGRTRIFRVKLSSLAVRTTFRFKFRDTFGIALRLRNSGARNGEDSTVRAHAASIDLDPCVPDPNSDGKTDSGDIAYGLQVLYGAQPPDVYDVEPTALDPECEGSCLRA